MHLSSPYLLFIGDVTDPNEAKTSIGIARWRPEWSLGQLRYHDCPIDLGIPDLTLEEAKTKGAKTLILGVANIGGIIKPSWRRTLTEAVELGFHIANGLHDRLTDDPKLVELAKKNNVQLIDIRYPSKAHSPTGTGKRRKGNRLLTVGTDCSVGKMFTTLSIEQEMQKRNLKAEFVATGQTGILISGRGVAIDAVVADFISGTVEALAPDHSDPDHWYLIEGQGSLFHPAYAGVSLGLLHGAQADRLVLCHDPRRTHIRGCPEYPQPDIFECIRQNEEAARLTNPDAKMIGCSLNTSYIKDDQEALEFIAAFEKKYGLPTTDTYRFGAGKIVDALENSFKA